MTLELDIQQLLLLGLFCAALHWLLARAEITRFAWSRAPRWLDKLLRCPACSGWWLGTALGWTRWVTPVSVCSDSWLARAGESASTGLLAIVLTPVLEALLLWGLERSAVREAEPEQGAVPACPLCAVANAPGARGPQGTCPECGALWAHSPLAP